MNMRCIPNLLHIPAYHHKSTRCCLQITKIFIAHFYLPWPCNFSSPTFFLWSEYRPQPPAIEAFPLDWVRSPWQCRFCLMQQLLLWTISQVP